ncbi:hypothetical protein LZ30DRAFT_726790 [Colletotrichum cereale]|nr:hypothetical protein LZ30DRAFT_726790 [Colletotrichum cereale]
MSGGYEQVHNADLQIDDLTAATNSTTVTFFPATSIFNESQSLLLARTPNSTPDHRNRPLSSATGQSSGSEVAIDAQTSNNITQTEDLRTASVKDTPLSPAEPHRYDRKNSSQHDHPITADPTHSPAVPASHPTRSLIYRLWLWEIAASIFSLACMAAIVGVLLYEDGRRLDEWGLGYAFHSPTVVVSLLGTLAKSASVLVITEVISQLKWLHFDSQPQKLSDLQLFDRASRGPWGALNLAFFKNRKALTASCASVLMLCFLLFDPFTQSVFRFPVILSPIQDGKTSILASLAYDPSSLGVSAADRCPAAPSIYSRMQAAILSPILDTKRPASLPCAFEKCEWPTVTTLGVCSDCMDLTETVIRTACVRDPTSWSRPVSCNYTVPFTNSTFETVFGRYGGVSATVPMASVWGSKAGRHWVDSLGLSYTELPDHSPTKDLGPTDLANFTFVQLFPETFYEDYATNGTFPPIRRAMHCKFELCARTFTKPSYENFLSSPLTGPRTRLIRSTKDTTSVEGRLQSGVHSSKVLIGLKSSNSTELSAETIFRINYCEWGHIGSYLTDLFTASKTNTGNSLEKEDTRWTPNLGIQLSQTDDIEALVHDIADSMTEVMRTSPNSTQFDGIAFSSVTYIEIIWERLALPLCTIVLSFLMLIVIIIRNRARGVSAWKSSSLALLFHELEGWSHDELKAPSLEYLDEKSAKMKGHMLRGDGGKLAIVKEA